MLIIIIDFYEKIWWLGNRLEKTTSALQSIGPAVLNGGLTTFLALALCSMSTGHVFLTFFKVFTLTVVFGLYHGLVVFPVILATLGPESEESSTPSISFSSSMTESTDDKKADKVNSGYEETETEKDIPDTSSTKVK